MNIENKKNKRDDIIKSLETLYKKYEDNEPVVEKIKTYIDSQLPNLLLKFIEKEKHKKHIEKEVTDFTNKFLYYGSIEYYYIKKTDLFIKYNGEYFSIINNDDLVHNILTNINLNKLLRKKKHQIKNNIIKRIKDNDLLKCIPNSNTIQFIINYLTPVFIKDRNTTKFFLTIIGDNILKKETENIYYLSPSCNIFMEYLNAHFKSYFKNSINIYKSFSYKYEPDKHEKYRIMDIDSIKVNNSWDIFLRKHILDIFAIAIHYSSRYKSADYFLENHLHESKSKSRILYLKNNNHDKIIKCFKEKYIIESNTISITKMELYYMWLEYLKNEKIPNIMSMGNFISNIELKYNNKTNLYEGITSDKLNYVKIFKKFWSETILSTDEENSDDIETSELFNLFNIWYKTKLITQTSYLDQTTMLSIYKHFYDIKLENGKIIKNISCSLWNKKESIVDILDDLKAQYKLLDEDNISFKKLYKDYCELLNLNNKRLIVSKQYFYKYIDKVIPQQYIKQNYILKEFWN